MYVINHSITPADAFDLHVGTSDNQTNTGKKVTGMSVYGYLYQSNGTYAKDRSSGNCFVIGYV
jgi:hypothetical protein